MTDEVTVVGGGIAGLVFARRLALAGRRVVVLERESYCGGQVTWQHIAGVALDAAAESFATRGGVVQRLLDELGLADRVCLPRPAPAWLVAADGSGAPLPATGILGIPADPRAADVVALIGERAADRAAQDATLPPSVGADASTLGELVWARMGRAVAERIVGPVVRGVHSIQADELPLVAVPGLADAFARAGTLAAAVAGLRAVAPAGSAVAGITGGMFTLTAGLVADCERLGVRIHTDVRNADVSGRCVRAAGVGRHPRRIVLVTLVVQSAELDVFPRGTGVLVTTADTESGVAARALTHLTAKWEWVAELLPGMHVLRLSYDLLPDVPVDQALADAARLLGARSLRLVDATVNTWQRNGGPVADAPPYAVGEWVAGPGLAAVIGHAERAAAEYEKMEP